MNKNIAKVLVGLPLEGPFDYSIPEKFRKQIRIGCRVWVQFNYRRLVGYVVGFAAQSKYKQIKSLSSLIDLQPVLDPPMLRFARAFAEYYCCTWAEAIETFLPAALRKGRGITLTTRQAKFLSKGNQFSGKVIHNFNQPKYWEIISENIRDCLVKDKSVLFLIPERGLLENRLELLKGAFKARIIVWNPQQGLKQQVSQWQQIKNQEADIVLGTRSAVFAPLANLGVVIVEEEDHAAYKNEQGPFYHVREVALMRCQKEKIRLVLSSCTPSLEAVYLTKNAKFKLIGPTGKKNLPLKQAVDLNQYYGKRERAAVFSLPLQEGLAKTLNEGRRAILFINRKGFSTYLRCRKCGFGLKCPRCNVSLTYHYDKNKLICRYCHYQSAPSQICPQCNSDYIGYLGRGIEKIESEAHRFFPGKKILRMDSERKDKPNNFDLLIATQIILKEPPLADADLVAALQVDNLLNRLDFRAAEKTFAVLVRLYRLAKQRFIIQTHNPDHYAIRSALEEDFTNFYKQELRIRRSLGFPPFNHFVSVVLRGRSEEKVKKTAAHLAEILNLNHPKTIEIFGPHPDIPARLRGNYRWGILLKGKSIKQLNGLIRASLKKMGSRSGIIVSVNVDI